MADVLLKTEKLSRKFAQGNTGNTVLNEVDIEIYQDDFTYINKLGGFLCSREYPKVCVNLQTDVR